MAYRNRLRASKETMRLEKDERSTVNVLVDKLRHKIGLLALVNRAQPFGNLLNRPRPPSRTADTLRRLCPLLCLMSSLSLPIVVVETLRKASG